MTEIGSFENQTVMKRMHLAFLRGGGNIFGNVILNFSSIQSKFFDRCRVNYRDSESE